MAYHYEPFNRLVAGAWGPWLGRDSMAEDPPEAVERAHVHNGTTIGKRDFRTTGLFWELSQVSTPPGEDWFGNPVYRAGDAYNYYFHESAGEGQYIYVV